MTTLFFDCFSGASGDMILGALLDAGADEAIVRAQLDALPLTGWSLELQPVTRGGIRATHAVVRLDGEQPSRDYAAITELLTKSPLDDRVRDLSARIFETLGKAEARVHDVELERVHFHEVGAVDSIVDIVGVSAALVSMHAGEIVCSPVAVGGGTTRTEHGLLPVPPPAVAEMIRGIPVRGGGEHELLTPTGAAILASVVDRFGDLPALRVTQTGYGAGTREGEGGAPNVLRVFAGEPSESSHARPALLFEANIDDMVPELFPRAIEQLLAAGAYDAWVTPIVMKKGRPAITLSALAPASERERVLDTFYAETTTFGVRTMHVDKNELERTWVEVLVEGHPLRIKVGRLGGRVVTSSPEYEDALRVARATGLPLKDIYRLATIEATKSTDR